MNTMTKMKVYYFRWLCQFIITKVHNIIASFGILCSFKMFLYIELNLIIIQNSKTLSNHDFLPDKWRWRTFQIRSILWCILCLYLNINSLWFFIQKLTGTTKIVSSKWYPNSHCAIANKQQQAYWFFLVPWQKDTWQFIKRYFFTLRD